MITAVIAPPAPIASLRVLNPDVPRNVAAEKGAVLDIHVDLSTGADIDIRFPWFAR